MDCSMPGFPVLHCLLEFVQTHVNWVGDVIQPFYPLLSPSPLALNLSQHQGLFQWVGSSHQVAKLLELQVQFLQHHSSKTSIPQHSAFFIVPLSHLYMTAGKTIALTIWTFPGKVMALLFNRLSRFDVTFLPRSKYLLILRLHSPPTVIWSPRKWILSYWLNKGCYYCSQSHRPKTRSFHSHSAHSLLIL